MFKHTANVVSDLSKYIRCYGVENGISVMFRDTDVDNYFVGGKVTNTALESLLNVIPSFEILSIIFQRNDVDDHVKKVLSGNYIDLHGYDVDSVVDPQPVTGKEFKSNLVIGVTAVSLSLIYGLITLYNLGVFA